jgi:hypothetical protein
VQSGFGRFTLSPVFWRGSATVKRSLGKGQVAGAARSNRAWTCAARAADGRRKTSGMTAASEKERTLKARARMGIIAVGLPGG